MGDPDGRVGGVHALTTGSGRAEDVDPQILFVDVHVVALLDDRGHLDACERRLPTGLVVERADPDQPMHTVLAAQGAVRKRHLDLEGRALDAGLFRLGGVHHLGRVAVPLGPAQVHPQQHLGPVGGVHAPSSGRQLHDRLALVVLPRQQGPHLERGDLLSQRGQVLDGLGHQVLVAELECGSNVIDPTA